MTPSEKLLAYLDAGGKLADFNARTPVVPTTADVVKAVGDTALVVAAPALTGEAQKLADAAVLDLTKDTQTKLDALAAATTSLAEQAGFTKDATEADVEAARAEKADAELSAAKLAKNYEIDADRDRQFAPIIAQREGRIAAVMAAATVEAVNAVQVGK